MEIIPNPQSNSTNKPWIPGAEEGWHGFFSCFFPKKAADLYFKWASSLRSFVEADSVLKIAQMITQDLPPKKRSSPCGATIRVMFNHLMKWSTPGGNPTWNSWLDLDTCPPKQRRLYFRCGPLPVYGDSLLNMVHNLGGHRHPWRGPYPNYSV